MDLKNSVILTDEGHFVSENMIRLNEILQDYDPYLELHWIPPDKRLAEDGPPFRLIHNPPSAEPYIVFQFTDLDDPQDILARLIAGDNWQKNVLQTLEAKEISDKIFRTKEQSESLQEEHDKMHFLLTNRSKHYVNWVDADGNKVRLDGDRKRKPL